MVPGLGGQIESEHYHRYLLAREFCRGKDVLDIASGEGYGSVFLAQVAKTVVGIDSSDAAVSHAIAAYSGSARLSFFCSDALTVPLADNSIDVVISFETLEHLVEHDAFLNEMKRVMRPDGLLVVSTPDREIYSASGEPQNPFHLKELSRSEFETLVGRHFSNWEIFDQRAIEGSTILAAAGAKIGCDFLIFERENERDFRSLRTIPAPRYLIALASAAKLPQLQASLYFGRSFSNHQPDRSGGTDSEIIDTLNRLTALREDYARGLNEVENRIEDLKNMRIAAAKKPPVADVQAAYSVQRRVQQAYSAIRRSAIDSLRPELRRRLRQASKILGRFALLRIFCRRRK
jgi:SAM-dependent methyltransferase